MLSIKWKFGEKGMLQRGGFTVLTSLSSLYSLIYREASGKAIDSFDMTDSVYFFEEFDMCCLHLKDEEAAVNALEVNAEIAL